jgi:hypothetical protein
MVGAHSYETGEILAPFLKCRNHSKKGHTTAIAATKEDIVTGVALYNIDIFQIASNLL